MEEGFLEPTKPLPQDISYVVPHPLYANTILPIASMMLCTGVEEKRNGEEKQGGEVEGRDGSNGARNQVLFGYTTEVWEPIFIEIMKHKF